MSENNLFGFQWQERHRRYVLFTSVNTCDRVPAAEDGLVVTALCLWNWNWVRMSESQEETILKETCLFIDNLMYFVCFVFLENRYISVFFKVIPRPWNQCLTIDAVVLSKKKAISVPNSSYTQLLPSLRPYAWSYLHCQTHPLFIEKLYIYITINALIYILRNSL